MNCEYYKQWISGYVDEEFDASEREQLERLIGSRRDRPADHVQQDQQQRLLEGVLPKDLRRRPVVG
jgi:anti-sigma factor RsiW